MTLTETEQVREALSDEPQTAPQLAHRLKINVLDVSDALAELRRKGMAVCVSTAGFFGEATWTAVGRPR